jgi:serine/threonine protein phosphatase PrpC
MSASTPPRTAQDPPAAWRVLTATERGAAHAATGLPNQDAVAAYPIGPYGAVVAVADGHGHQRHFRSARGSRLAVVVACKAVHELPARLDRLTAARQVEGETRAFLVPAIAELWRAAVSKDLDGKPFTPAEEASRAAAGDDAVIAYGSTLLLAVVWRQWLMLAQIGDGDIVGILPDGGALLPVPDDPSLDGRQTTSLCEPRAAEEFRVAVVDISSTPLLGIMLATDGYGNAQLADPWTDAFSKDLSELLGKRDPDWLADQLPMWAGRCASREGSADDTTIAFLLAPREPCPNDRPR